ncbi:hypothetical protein ACQP1O_19930 [Nocardia sp. CA-151230]|uniref:hypothetical protein n=1 Tax=Nocardia sp. CA-151230 TaxID=3239982 RepID=UPI003D8BC560
MTTDTTLVDIANADSEDAVADSKSEDHKHHSSGKSSRLAERFAIRRRFQRLSGMRRGSAIATMVVLGLLLGATILATGLLEQHVADHRATATAAREARDSAQSRVPKVLSYDFNTVDNEFNGATQNLTGKFRDDFTKLGATVIIPAAHRDSIVTKATIVGTAMVSADRDNVVLLLFLNQETTSTKYQGRRLDGSRVRVTMAKAAGTWLISDITPV